MGTNMWSSEEARGHEDKPVSQSVSRNFRFLFSSYKCDNEAEKVANLIVLTVQTASQTCIIAEVKF